MPRGTLYIGVTNDLIRRVQEHRQKLVGGFTKRYNISQLVYYETTEDVLSAITREKQIKGWVRAEKAALIESMNLPRPFALRASLRVTGQQDAIAPVLSLAGLWFLGLLNLWLTASDELVQHPQFLSKWHPSLPRCSALLVSKELF